jgi:lipoprotein NlpI
LHNRGAAYADKGQYTYAIDDFRRAIMIDRKNEVMFLNRGLAYQGKGDYDRAAKDFDRSISVKRTAMAFFHRGRLNMYLGALDEALRDLNQASGMDPKDVYAVLWIDIVNKRSKQPGRLALDAKRLDMTKWPAPVVRLYLGELTPEALLATADNADAEIKKGQVCEAHFYSGQLALQQNKKDEAKRLFALAAADCPKSFMESPSAEVELKALGN